MFLLLFVFFSNFLLIFNVLTNNPIFPLIFNISADPNERWGSEYQGRGSWRYLPRRKNKKVKSKFLEKPKNPKKELSLAEQLKANQNKLVAAGALEVKQNEITMPKFGNPMEEMAWLNSDAGKEWKAQQAAKKK